MSSRRLVAVAISVDEVLDPASDLNRVSRDAGEVDVLVARVDRPGAGREPSPLTAPDYPDEPGAGALAGFTVPLRPGGARLHHLALRWRVQDGDLPDLVAALSELIGFDPDAGVVCVAPVGGPADSETAVLEKAVRRVAMVYGLPVLRYHSAGDPGRIIPPLTRVEPAV